MANEKRLIDANKVLERADEVTFMGFRAEERKKHFMDLVSEILKQPTVDAVEVVRCKDCQWFDKAGYEENNAHEDDLSLHMGWCADWRRGTQACGFCSHGERKV